MKPRTAIDKLADRAARRLPPLTEAQKRWARKALFPHDGYISGGNTWCSGCGHVFTTSPTEERIICPSCGEVLEGKKSRKQKVKEEYFMTILTTCNGLQVQRTFIVKRQGRKGEGVAYTYNEVVQLWLDERGRVSVRACNKQPFSYYYDRFIYGTMSTKRAADMAQYSFYGEIYPHQRVLPVLKRNGYKRLYDVMPFDVMLLVLTEPKAETLAKAGQDELLRYMANTRWWRAQEEWHAVKIAIRHGYYVTDATLWRDYIKALAELDYDTHNPRYVCPDDLKAAHDKFIEKRDRKRQKERLEKLRAQVVAEEQAYRDNKQQLLGLLLVGNGITIRPLQSVEEFLCEGDTMHHCVFTNEYYKKPQSLILTARNEHDERLETIELDITTFKVLQSRGMFNKCTEDHGKILELINDNIKQIRSYGKRASNQGDRATA